MATKESKIKDARFDARLSQAQKDFFEKAARIGGFRNLTDFVIMAVQEKAKEIISDNERIIATQRDRNIFFDAVMNPQEPNEELLKAVEEYNSLSE